MSVVIRQGNEGDLADLLALMREFYAESGYSLNSARARDAFLPLLTPGALGQVWLAELDGEPAGHLVLTFCYSMEYGGRSAFVDDLFVRPAARQRGVGRALVERARAICEALGIRAMHLEVARENAPAQALYRAVGFESTDRQLLTLGLAAATHEA
jgi:ribosomal protein S18 acetylase RimI-like enzyme